MGSQLLTLAWKPAFADSCSGSTQASCRSRQRGALWRSTACQAGGRGNTVHDRRG